MNEIFSRVSVRKFKNSSVDKEKIEKLLRAAMAALSAGNQQCWEFIVVENKDILKFLSYMSPYAKALEDAPLAIIVLGNMDRMIYPENWQQDLGAATENILLEAVHLGLGGVWLGVAPLKNRMKYVADFFNLKDNLKVYAVVPLGYPDKEYEAKDRYDETKIHFEVY